MASKIVWTDNALADLESVKNYLEEAWPPNVLTGFLNKLVDKLKVIETFPEIGRASEKFPKRRRFLITNHNLLIYSLQNEE